MKKLFYLLVMPLLLLGACEDAGEEVIPEINIDVQASQFENNGGEQTVTFTSTTAWSAQVVTTRDAENWCAVEPTRGQAGEVTLTITTQPNTTPEERSATVTIIAGDVEKSFTVTQKQKDVVTIEGSTYKLEAEGGEVEITVSANVEYTYSIDDEAQSWVSFKETRAVTTSTYVFEVAENTLTEERSATISFAAANGDESLNREVTITQAAAKVPAPANNEIWYTTTTGEVIEFSEWARLEEFGANIISHTYENGKGVITFDGEITTIATFAFLSSDRNPLYIETVTLPESITTIGDSAFDGNSTLISVNIPSKVTYIGSGAFSGSSITDITIPEGITVMQGFNGCALLSSINIPESVTSIGESAFQGCLSLSSITIPESVTSIEWRAFRNCSSLSSITIPESVKSIGEAAFDGCSSLSSITLPEGLESIGERAFGNTAISSITIPESVTEIGKCIFSGCTMLSEINGKFATEDNKSLVVDGTLLAIAPYNMTEYTVPESATIIGSEVLREYRDITSIILHDNITKIDDDAFRYSSITEIELPENLEVIGNGAFSYSKLESIEFPDKLREIGKEAFCSTNIRNITIPSTIQTLGEYIFDGCESLESVVFEDGIVTIPKGIFCWSTKLSEVSLPNTVETIGSTAFSHCESLQEITIPESVNKIELSAFIECYSLNKILFRGTTPPSLDSYALGRVTDNPNRKIYVPAESVEAYKSAAGWSEYADYIFADPSTESDNDNDEGGEDEDIDPSKFDIVGQYEKAEWHSNYHTKVAPHQSTNGLFSTNVIDYATNLGYTGTIRKYGLVYYGNMQLFFNIDLTKEIDPENVIDFDPNLIPNVERVADGWNAAAYEDKNYCQKQFAEKPGSGCYAIVDLVDRTDGSEDIIISNYSYVNIKTGEVFFDINIMGWTSPGSQINPWNNDCPLMEGYDHPGDKYSVKFYNKKALE